MIRIEKIEHHEYVFTVLGNGGEEQFVVVHSCGQGGYTAIHIIQAACDMTMRHLRGGKVPTRDVGQVVQEAAVEAGWGDGSKRIADAFAEKFYM